MHNANILMAKYYNTHAERYLLLWVIQWLNPMGSLWVEMDFKECEYAYNRFIFSVKGIGRFR